MSGFKICVIGAGVAGLTTALELQKQIPKADVSIIADRFLSDTTSHVAAGVFYPGSSFNAPSENLKMEWAKTSYKYWNDIRKTSYASNAGVTSISGYLLSSTDPEEVRNRYLEELVPIYRPATEEELNLVEGNWKYGSFLSTLLIECDRFLPWATNEFRRHGGKIIQQRVDNFSNLPSTFDIIMNCTGIGAKHLCKDNKLHPLRGQIVKVEAPWIKMFFFGDDDIYIIPGFEGVTLGCICQFGSSKMTVDEWDSRTIKGKCEKFLPSLRGSRVIAERVGLRPYRSEVRVEKEIKQLEGNRKLKIVHNYGHGSCGITMSPGTATAAVTLAKELWMGNSKY